MGESREINGKKDYVTKDVASRRILNQCSTNPKQNSHSSGVCD
jgi:hypothetical protein